jgi:hypothetical protein
MKRYKDFILVFLSILAFISCSSVDRKDVNVGNAAQWRDDIKALNAKYAQMQVIPNAINRPNMPQLCKNVDGWEVAYWDAIGATRGVRIGKYFGGAYGAVIGAVVAGGGLSIASYLAQRGYQTTSNEENLTLTATEISQWILDNSPNTSDPDFKYLIDSRDPIRPWNDIYGVTSNVIGVEAGPMHNFVVTKVLTDSNYNSWYNDESLLHSILEVMNDYHLISDDDLYEVAERVVETYVAEDWSNTSSIEETFQEIEDQLVDIEVFFDIAFDLDSILLYEYASEYTAIIDNAWRNGFIEEEDALLINTSISVGCYSHMMWNKYLENEVSSNLRIAFDTIHNDIIYCDKQALITLLSAGTVQFYGIPHLVRNRIAEIYFYGTPHTQCALPDVNYLEIPSDVNSVITGELCYLYNDLCILQPGQYPISSVFSTQGDIRYIRFYDYIENQ